MTMTPQEYHELMMKQAELNKKKKVLEFSSSNPAEWYELAHEYELIDSRANYAYCIQRAVHYAGFSTPVAVAEVEPELEVYDWQLQDNNGGG